MKLERRDRVHTVALLYAMFYSFLDLFEHQALRMNVGKNSPFSALCFNGAHVVRGIHSLLAQLRPRYAPGLWEACAIRDLHTSLYIYSLRCFHLRRKLQLMFPRPPWQIFDNEWCEMFLLAPHLVSKLEILTPPWVQFQLVTDQTYCLFDEVPCSSRSASVPHSWQSWKRYPQTYIHRSKYPTIRSLNYRSSPTMLKQVWWFEGTELLMSRTQNLRLWHYSE